MSVTQKSLDLILGELGDFGKYQRRNFILICLAVVYMTVHLSYVFTARDLNYRCKVEECDLTSNVYNPKWLSEAIPIKNERPAKCEVYKRISKSNDTSRECLANNFDQNQTEHCDSFIYETSETSIVNDFDLHCSENLWKLTLVGTINNIGQFVCLPVAGFVSDRFGRRTLLVGGLVMSSIAGFLRSFSPSYFWFLLFEFLDTSFGAGSFSCAFILGVELVGPERRVLIGTIISCAFATGETILGLIAWATKSWRLLLQVVYPPGILFISYIWLMPDSVRWLLAKGRTEDAVSVLNKAAKINGKSISPNALEKLTLKGDEEQQQSTYPIMDIFKSKLLMLRLLACSFCWMTCTFSFYGLSLHSVALTGNAYINFIMTSLIEIPGYLATYVLVDRIGRRASQLLAFAITASACFAFIFIPSGQFILKLIVYLTGKFGATLAFTVVYVFTSEMFPTPLRHSLLATCSMIGRIGSMVAPQTPVLAHIWEQLPIVLFGAMASVAALLSLSFPETLNTKLPDTIEEAEKIGVRHRKESSSNHV